MAYPLSPVLLSTIDALAPLGTEDAAQIDEIFRQTRSIFKNIILVAHNDDGTLKATAAVGDNSITTAKLQAECVDSTKLKQTGGSEAVITAAIRALAVTEAKLAATSVTNTKLGLLAVDNAQLAALAVTTAKLAAMAVTDAKLASDPANDALRAVGATHIKSGAVADSHIAAGLTLAKLASAGAGRFVVDDGGVSSMQVDGGGDVGMAVVAGKVKLTFTNVLKYFANAVLIMERGNFGGGAVNDAFVARPWPYTPGGYSTADSAWSIYPDPNDYVEIVSTNTETVAGMVVVLKTVKFKQSGTFFVRGQALACINGGDATSVGCHVVKFMKISAHPFATSVKTDLITGTSARQTNEMQTFSYFEGFVTVNANDECCFMHYYKLLAGTAGKPYMGLGTTGIPGQEILASLFITKVS